MIYLLAAHYTATLKQWNVDGGCALELWWMCSSDRWKGLRLSLNPSPAYKPILLLVTLLQFPLSFLRLELAQKRESLVA